MKKLPSLLIGIFVIITVNAGSVFAEECVDTTDWCTNVSNVNIDGQGNGAVIDTGGPVSVTANYKVWNAQHCPACIHQIIVGVNYDAQLCVYNGIPGLYPGKEEYSAFTLTVPNIPGTYDVEYCRTLTYSCADGQHQYETDICWPRFKIGTITVKSPCSSADVIVKSTEQILADPHIHSSARWSHDGTKIAYATSKGGTYNVWIMNPDGSSQTQLTNDPVLNEMPVSWTVDDSRILYQKSSVDRYHREIWIMNANGTNQHLLIPAQHGLQPDSGDVNSLGKVVYNLENDALYTVSLDGTNNTMLLYWGSQILAPTWSHDDAKIGFKARKGWTGSQPNDAIWTINADGTGLTQLTDGVWTGFCSWSPDDSMIAYERPAPGETSLDPNWDIYLMNSDGTEDRPLLNDTAQEFFFDFNPDGTKGVYTVRREGKEGVWIATLGCKPTPQPPPASEFPFLSVAASSLLVSLGAALLLARRK